jgi:hypothetical protein
MSALGQKRILGKARMMSALLLIADIGTRLWTVRFVPTSPNLIGMRQLKFEPTIATAVRPWYHAF